MNHASDSRSPRLGHLVVAVACLATPCLAQAGATARTAGADRPVAADAARAAPKEPLRVGDRLPMARLRGADDLPVRLTDIVEESPVVLILYRGGWCTYCTRHLAEFAEVRERLVELGFRTIAVSPDRPERMRETAKQQSEGVTLLSDSDLQLPTALGLAFRVDDSTIEVYERLGIDLAAASGRDHRMLPVPAVYLIDQEGTIRSAHHDSDHRSRLSAADVVGAAERIVAEAGQR